MLDGQVFLVKNLVAEDIGHGDFCCRYQEKVVKIGMIHLPFLVRKLTCAQARSFIDNIRRLDFYIARLACFIKEESFECTLETCHFADIYWETCPRNLHPEVEVYEIIFLQQVPMAEGIIAQLRHVSDIFFDNNIAACIFAFRDSVVWNVWNVKECLRHIPLCLVHDFLECLVGSFQFSNSVLDFFGFFFLAFFHQTTNLLSQLILLLFIGVKLLLSLTTDFVVF